MKKIRKILPFLAVLVLLFGSVALSRLIHTKPENFYHVNTAPDKNGEIHTIQLFDSISSVMIIDFDNHSKKKQLPREEYEYDKSTTRLMLKNPLPFKNPVIHIEGIAREPETFFLHDFEGTRENLLVLLRDREAIEQYEYSYDSTTRLLTFRNDIHPENDGNFIITYKTKDGELHSFGNWGKKDGDKLAELQNNWLSKIENTNIPVMKERTGVSNRKLSREVGFKINLPKGNSTFLCETMEENKKKISVMRWYDELGATIECKPTPFERVEGQNQIFVRDWETDGTYYRLTGEVEKKEEIERFLEKH